MRIKLVVLLLLAASCLKAQPPIITNRVGGGFVFNIKKMVSSTPVKDQHQSNTCWCYATESLLESELMRMGKGTYDLSEAFVVRNMYIQKAERYIRFHGAATFSPGGEPHDVMNAIREYGILPMEAYPGSAGTPDKPMHGEMDGVLKAMLDAMIKTPDGSLSPNWKQAFIGALDGYLGVPPESFTYEGKTYTAKSYAQWLGIDANDYVEITSFTHHPFYTPFILEVPDNWSHELFYNVPLEDLKRIADNAIANDYTIDWACDVSEKGFSFRNGLAIVPVKNYDDMNGDEKDSMFLTPLPEKFINQRVRQESFDNLTTTDDHGMQIVATAEDQTGKPYYLVKNSWGADNDLKGYFYCSVPYFLYKTTSIMVNKKAIPKDILVKLGLKI